MSMEVASTWKVFPEELLDGHFRLILYLLWNPKEDQVVGILSATKSTIDTFIFFALA